MLLLYEEAREAIGGRAGTHAGRCTVGLLEDLAITTLPAALADFGRLHPQVELEVIIGAAAPLRRLAGRGRLDLVFGDPAALPEAAIRWRRQAELVWAFSRVSPGRNNDRARTCRPDIELAGHRTLP